VSVKARVARLEKAVALADEPRRPDISEDEQIRALAAAMDEAERTGDNSYHGRSLRSLREALAELVKVGDGY